VPATTQLRVPARVLALTASKLIKLACAAPYAPRAGDRISKLVVDPRNRRAKATTIPLPAQHTARWCRVSPVSEFGALIEGLEPDSMYVDITVQCVNQVGAGSISNTLPLVQTHGNDATTCCKSLPPSRTIRLV
jgi:hypothetical protein